MQWLFSEMHFHLTVEVYLKLLVNFINFALKSHQLPKPANSNVQQGTMNANCLIQWIRFYGMALWVMKLLGLVLKIYSACFLQDLYFCPNQQTDTIFNSQKLVSTHVFKFPYIPAFCEWPHHIDFVNKCLVVNLRNKVLTKKLCTESTTDST